MRLYLLLQQLTQLLQAEVQRAGEEEYLMRPPIARITHDCRHPRLLKQRRLLQPQAPMHLIRRQVPIRPPHHPRSIRDIEPPVLVVPRCDQTACCQKYEGSHMIPRRWVRCCGLLKLLVTFQSFEDDEIDQPQAKRKVGEEDQVGSAIGVHAWRRRVPMQLALAEMFSGVARRGEAWRRHEEDSDDGRSTNVQLTA
jgi:hypothetical protein